MRLCTRLEYKRMAYKARKLVGQRILIDLQVFSASSPVLGSKLGIAVIKKYGNAPQRNRFKRLVREAFRLSYPDFEWSCNMVIRPRTSALQASLSDIQQELMGLLIPFMKNKRDNL